MTESCFSICLLFQDGHPYTSTWLQPNNCSPGSPFLTSPRISCYVICTAHQLFQRDGPCHFQWFTCCSWLWLYLCYQLWPTWLCWTNLPSTVHQIERNCLRFTSQRNWNCQLDVSEWWWHLFYCLVDMSLCSSCFTMTPSAATTIWSWQYMQSQWCLDCIWQGHTYVLPRPLHESSDLHTMKHWIYQLWNWLLASLTIKLFNALSKILPFLKTNELTICHPPHASFYASTITWATKGSSSYRSGPLKAKTEFQVMLQVVWSQCVMHANMVLQRNAYTKHQTLALWLALHWVQVISSPWIRWLQVA